MCLDVDEGTVFQHTGASYGNYSFDQNGIHFVILDACFREDGVPYGSKNFDWRDTEIPKDQRDWLASDLAASSRPTLVFVHQRLDIEGDFGVKSASSVRKILEESGNVLAVFQGHSHENEHAEINGIHYCTLAAMIEGSGPDNSAYGILSVYEDGTLKLKGFRKQKDYIFTRA